MSFIKSVLLITALGSTAASAFEFSGGDVGLSYTNFAGPEYSSGSTEISGSAAFKFDEKFGGQINIGSLYESSPFWSYEAQTIDIHLAYVASPDVTLGVFAGKTTESGGYSYSRYGMEAKVALDKLDLNIALQELQENDGSFQSSTINVDGSYLVGNNFSFLGGVQLRNAENEAQVRSTNRSYIGVKYDFQPNIAASIKVGKFMPYDETTTSLGLTYKFGKGRIFSPRG